MTMNTAFQAASSLFPFVKLKPHIFFIMKNNSIFAQFAQPRHSQGTAKAIELINRFNYLWRPFCLGMIFMFIWSFPNVVKGQGTACGTSYDYAITNASASSLFPGSGTGNWPSGSRIFVTGTFIIDKSLVLDNLVFIMNSSSSIQVTGSGTNMVAQNLTTFRGCFGGSMWNGITVGSMTRINLSYTTIKDALTAITLISSAQVQNSSIDNCTIENSRIGIYATGFTSSNPLTFSAFSGNTIQRGISANLPPFNNLPLHSGILIINSIGDFASNALSTNLVQGFKFGVYARNSTLTFANWRFKNQVGDPTSGDTLAGASIYAKNCNLVVGGKGTTRCEFYTEGNVGIHSEFTRNLSVTNAYFDSQERYSIKCTQNIYLDPFITVQDNTFLMNGAFTIAAICIERPPSSSGPSVTHTRVSNNQISISSGHQKKPILMIEVRGKVAATDAAKIDSNKINVAVTFSNVNGIRITGKGDYYSVEDQNILNWLPSGTPNSTTIKSRGILANDLTGNKNRVVGNVISSKLSGNNSYLQTGIDAERSPYKLLICSNIIQNTHKGIQCIDDLSLTKLKTNNLGNAAYGLYCNKKAVMPDQERFENTWTGNYTTKGAFYDVISPMFKIIVDQNVPQTQPPNLSWSPSNWFQTANGPSMNFCSFIDLLEISDKERSFINGSVSSDDTDASNWDTRRVLLYKLMQVSDLASVDASANTYLTANVSAGTSAWKYARAEWLFDQAYTLSASLTTQIRDKGLECQTYNNNLISTDGQMNNSGATVSLLGQRRSQFNQLVTAANDLDGLRAQAAPAISQGLQTAQTYVQGLPQTNTFELNLKQILGIAIRYMQGDSLIESDYAVLRAIAAQCPTTGGKSVYMAPIWMLHEEAINYLDYDWESPCGGGGGGNAATVSTSTPSILTAQIKPNPAKDQITCTFPVEELSGKWQFVNFTGQVLQSGKWSASDILSIDVHILPVGIYALQWSGQSGEVHSSKVSITR